MSCSHAYTASTVQLIRHLNVKKVTLGEVLFNTYQKNQKAMLRMRFKKNFENQQNWKISNFKKFWNFIIHLLLWICNNIFDIFNDIKTLLFKYIGFVWRLGQMLWWIFVVWPVVKKHVSYIIFSFFDKMFQVGLTTKCTRYDTLYYK